MLEIHVQASQQGAAAYHEFLLYYRNDAKVVYGFVEGKDDPTFYRGLIEQLLDDDWAIRLINAGNRQRVLNILVNMDWARFPRKRVCFYVDRDLSDYLDEEIPSCSNLYVTDGYSVESWVVNIGTCVRACEELLGLQKMTLAEITDLHRRFEESIRMFREAMMPVMGQILMWRRARSGPSLDNIRLNECFAFVDGALIYSEQCATKNERLAKVAVWCALETSDIDDIERVERELLEDHDPAGVIRGKYLIWFLVKFLLSVRDGAQRLFSNYRVTNPRARVSLGIENAMALLANRVRIPETLRTFVRRNYIEYIEGLPG